MMSERFRSIDLVVNHVGNVAEWIPVEIADVTAGKRPNNSLLRQASGYFRPFVDELVIVIVDEFVAKRLSEHEPGDDAQKKTNAQNDPGTRVVIMAWIGHWREKDHEQERSSCNCRCCAEDPRPKPHYFWRSPNPRLFEL